MPHETFNAMIEAGIISDDATATQLLYLSGDLLMSVMIGAGWLQEYYKEDTADIIEDLRGALANLPAGAFSLVMLYDMSKVEARAFELYVLPAFPNATIEPVVHNGDVAYKVELHTLKGVQNAV